MKIFKSFEDAKEIENPVVTTGSFDGVHVGHKAILNRIRLLADRHKGESVLITFHPHPRLVLYPETAGKDLRLINSQEEKLFLLEKAGLDNIIIIEFTREFSRITSEQFVRDFLHDKLKVRVVVAGFNHHFGFNKEGAYKQLWDWQGKYHFEAEEIPEQEVYNETVSSTKIRQAISEGYIQRANAYLDHFYVIMGLGKEYIPKAPSYIPPMQKILITEEYKLLPAPGIYAVSVESGMSMSKGMLIVNEKSADYPEVMLDIFKKSDFHPQDNLLISFHKKVHGNLNLNEEIVSQKLRKAKDDISELIY